jgi:gas vesicle protein
MQAIAHLALRRMGTMSQESNFLGGFLTGAVLGGVVGGIVGVLVTARLSQNATPEEGLAKLDGKSEKSKKGRLKAPTEQSIEAARQGLEDKIAQLNDAIDDVRLQLGSVNGNKQELSGERAIAPDS